MKLHIDSVFDCSMLKNQFRSKGPRLSFACPHGPSAGPPIVAPSLLLHSNLIDPLCSLFHLELEPTLSACSSATDLIHPQCISQSVTKDVISMICPGILSHPYMSKQIERKLRKEKKKSQREKKSLCWYINLWYLNLSENPKEMKKQSGYTTPNNVVRRNAKSKVITENDRKMVRG